MWHKATSADFCGFVMPADDKSPVLIVGSGHAPYKTTQATADFSAVCAIAARVYRNVDSAYADRCLDAATRAWSWAIAHPEEHFKDNPDGIKKTLLWLNEAAGTAATDGGERDRGD